MKKRIVCLTLALLMSATQVVSVSASREDELREEQAITSQQLDATYSRMDELAYAKSQLENEISELDSNLVSVMVSIDTLKGDIDNKEVDICAPRCRRRDLPGSDLSACWAGAMRSRFCRR